MMTLRFSMNETDDVTPLPPLSVGPTGQVNRQYNVMQQRRRLRAITQKNSCGLSSMYLSNVAASVSRVSGSPSE
jgi:hypothetical protein